MARDFELVKAAGLLPQVRDLDHYESLTSQGLAEASAYLRILTQEGNPLCAPGPDDLLNLYGVLYGHVYEGAGEQFRPDGHGQIVLDQCEFPNDRKKWKCAASPQIIRQELGLLCHETEALLKSAGFADPRAEASALAKLEVISFWHYRFQRIHPFKDGNGRLGRMISNHQAQNLIHPQAKIISSGSEDTRDRYIWALKKCGRREDLRPLSEFFAEQISLSLGNPFLSPEEAKLLVKTEQTPPYPLAKWAS
jgi:fido (protein-threonine AMPylation protein)